MKFFTHNPKPKTPCADVDGTQDNKSALTSKSPTDRRADYSKYRGILNDFAWFWSESYVIMCSLKKNTKHNESLDPYCLKDTLKSVSSLHPRLGFELEHCERIDDAGILAEPCYEFRSIERNSSWCPWLASLHQSCSIQPYCIDESRIPKMTWSGQHFNIFMFDWGSAPDYLLDRSSWLTDSISVSYTHLTLPTILLV